MICLLGTFLVNQKYNLDHASQIFSKTVDIDWGSNLSFDAKVSQQHPPPACKT